MMRTLEAPHHEFAGTTGAASRRPGSASPELRQSLAEIAVEVDNALRAENLPSIVVTVPTRYSLVTIAGPRDVPFDEWSRMSAIVRGVLEQKLGGERYRGRPLFHAVANATTNSGALD